MEDFRKHVQDISTVEKEKKMISYCGEYIQDFAFVGVDHLMSVMQNKGILLSCPKCRKEIINIIKNENNL